MRLETRYSADHFKPCTVGYFCMSEKLGPFRRPRLLLPGNGLTTEEQLWHAKLPLFLRTCEARSNIIQRIPGGPSLFSVAAFVTGHPDHRRSRR